MKQLKLKLNILLGKSTKQKMAIAI